MRIRPDAMKLAAWYVGVLVVWPSWYLLYGLAFAWVNESLTRVDSLTAANGMLAPGLELGLQTVMAAIFGFAGVWGLRLVRAPRPTAYAAAGLSLVLSLATVLLWRATEADSATSSAPFPTYALVGAVMALGCLTAIRLPRRCRPEPKLHAVESQA